MNRTEIKPLTAKELKVGDKIYIANVRNYDSGKPHYCAIIDKIGTKYITIDKILGINSFSDV
jgi:hypothetical protein